VKAIRVSAPGAVQVVELPRPQAAPGEVMVRVARAGLCATDRKLMIRGADPPRVPGHEVAGYLEDGSEVGLHPDLGCGKCRWCSAGLENRCPDGVSIGLDRDGGLAEWVAVPRSHALGLQGVPMEIAPVLEPLACCVHAVSQLEVEPGTPALVVGAGSMGILALWALQAAGARVVVAQRSLPRRHLAAEVGADGVLGPEENPADVLGEPPRAALVTAPSARALSWALERVAVGGRVHAFAGIPEGGAVDPNLVHYRHLRLVGSTGSTVDDYVTARTLVADGTVKLDRLPVSTISLEEAPEVLRREPDVLPLKILVSIGEKP
jgi:L-iditol 2-dehydrogenase